MEDDLNKKIKQITDILSQEKLPENLSGLLSLLAASAAKGEPRQKEEAANENLSLSRNSENAELLRKAKKVMDELTSSNDPKLNLLLAVKPFLSSRRQSRLDTCIKILQLYNLARFLDEKHKDGSL